MSSSRLRFLAAGAASLLSVPLFAAPASALTFIPAGGGGMPFEVQDDTDDDDGGIDDGGNDAFDDWGMLGLEVLDESSVSIAGPTELQGFGLTFDDDRSFDGTTPITSGGVEVTRDLYAPADLRLMRYYDTFTNTSAANRTVQVVWGGNLGSDGSTEVYTTSSGDASITGADTWAVTVEDDATQPVVGPFDDPVVGYLFGNAGGAPSSGPTNFPDSSAAWGGDSDDSLGFAFEFTLAPGESTALLNFLYLGLPGALSQAEQAATDLGRLAAGTTELPLEGLTGPQLAMVRNFDLTDDAYRMVTQTGAVSSFGSASFGSAAVTTPSGRQLSGEIVGIARVRGGYYLATSDGKVFQFGSATHYGDLAGQRLNAPIVGITAAANGGAGYYLVASDGGVFTFGPDATFSGSAGALTLNKPVVGMAADPDGTGYWLVASDGGIFSYAATFHGSAGALTLNKAIVGMSATDTGGGYHLVASDGGIFNYGDAGFSGSLGGNPPASPIVGIA